MKRRVISICLMTTILLLVSVPAAKAASSELSFVEPEKLAVTYSGEASKEVSVWLKNASVKDVTPKFSTVLEDSDGEPANVAVQVVGEKKTTGAPSPIAAGQVSRYRLVFSQPSKSSGQLIATGEGVDPASVSLSLGPELPSTRGVNAALIIPLGIAIILLLAAWLYGHGDVGLMGKLGGVAELDFSKSFASTLTAVGALLGTIIAAGVLPEETVNLSKSGFVGLNLAFGIAIVVAAAVSGSFLSSKAVVNKDGKKEWQLEGYVMPFIFGALITLWAVFGELYTLWLLVGELSVEKGFTSLGVTMLRALLVVGALAMIPYTLVKVRVAVAKPTVPEPAVAVPAPPVPPPAGAPAPPSPPKPALSGEAPLPKVQVL